MKSLFLSLSAMVPLAAAAAEQQYWVAPTKGNTCYWVPGFSLDNPASWNFDVDKLNNKMEGDEGADKIVASGEVLDGHYCWAASAANIAAQWEARNEETVKNEMQRDPMSAEDIYTEFKNAFYHTSGDTISAANWYFVGNPSLPLKPEVSAQGGYYKDIVTYETKYTEYRTLNNHGWSLVEEDPAIAYGWDESAYDRDSICRQWTDALVSTLGAGYSISIGAQGTYEVDGSVGTYGHALTLWGVEVDVNGYLTRMWLTDSDDATSYAEDMGLFSVSCIAVEDTDWMYNANFGKEPGASLYVGGLTTYYYMQSDVPAEVDGEPYYWYKGYDEETGLGDRLSDISAIRITSNLYEENPIVPEPATGTLSLLALSLFAARRRRK